MKLQVRLAEQLCCNSCSARALQDWEVPHMQLFHHTQQHLPHKKSKSSMRCE